MGAGMARPALGDRELDVLRFVAEHAPISAPEVAERFGEAQGLARTTVVTLMERLRKKGYLTRQRNQGLYRYAPRVPQAEVLQGLVRDFIERTLGGSVSPVFAYLTRARELSDAEIAELEQWFAEMKAKEAGGERG